MPNLASEKYNPAFLRPKTASVKLRIISERLFFSILEANFTSGEDEEQTDFKERKGVRKQEKEETCKRVLIISNPRKILTFQSLKFKLLEQEHNMELSHT